MMNRRKVNQSQEKDPAVYTSIDALRRLQFKTKGLSFLPKQPVKSILNGKNVSKLRGRGLNFEEMRQYHLGDDIRTMDWKVTLRTGKPHVKVFNEERERDVFLLVDQRLNMFFGSTGKMKSVIAAEVAALTGWRVIESTDRIGAIIFNDDNAVSFKPKRSHHQISLIIAELVNKNHQLASGSVATDYSTSLNRAFEKLIRVITHDALVIFISDGRGWNDKTTEYLKKLRQHNDMIICHVVDPLELELPKLSQTILSDGQLQIEISDAETRIYQSYREKIEQQLTKLTSISAKYRIPVLPFETLSPTDKQMRKALGV